MKLQFENKEELLSFLKENLVLTLEEKIQKHTGDFYMEATVKLEEIILLSKSY